MKGLGLEQLAIILLFTEWVLGDKDEAKRKRKIISFALACLVMLLLSGCAWTGKPLPQSGL